MGTKKLYTNKKESKLNKNVSLIRMQNNEEPNLNKDLM